MRVSNDVDQDPSVSGKRFIPTTPWPQGSNRTHLLKRIHLMYLGSKQACLGLRMHERIFVQKVMPEYAAFRAYWD